WSGSKICAHAGAVRNGRGAAEGRAAQRQRAATVERDCAVHAAIIEDYAQPASAGHGPARPPLFLAFRAADHRWNRSRYGPGCGSRRRHFDHAARAGSYGWTFTEPSFALGKIAGRGCAGLKISQMTNSNEISECQI